MLYLYWMFDCKTPDCKNRRIRATYIGEFEGAAMFSGSPPSPYFRFHCDDCGKDHTYTDQDLKIAGGDQPLPDFRSLF
jgi:hypothetical protein